MINEPKIKELKGTFKKCGKSYISDTAILTLHQRKNFNDLKPQYYLMVRLNGQQKPIYLSSLYPKNGCFIAEKNRQFWGVNITEESICLVQIGSRRDYLPSILLGDSQLKLDASK